MKEQLFVMKNAISTLKIHNLKQNPADYLNFVNYKYKTDLAASIVLLTFGSDTSINVGA